MRRKLFMHISDSKEVAADENQYLEYQIEDSGKVFFQEISIAFDSNLRTDGKFQIYVGSQKVTAGDGVSFPNGVSSISLTNIETPISKGDKVRVDVFQATGATTGEFQLLVIGYVTEVA